MVAGFGVGLSWAGVIMSFEQLNNYGRNNDIPIEHNSGWKAILAFKKTYTR